MINEVKILSKVYEETLLDIMKSEDDWIMFLKTLSRNYMLKFDEQVLVYRQKPSSTALLEKRHWENIFHRSVKTVAKGIKVFCHERQEIRSLFDVQDTEETSISIAIPKWNFKEIYHNDVSFFISKKFGIESKNRKIDISYIRDLTDHLVNEVEDSYKNIRYIFKGTEDELEELVYVYKDFVKSSIAYIVYERIYEDSDSFFDNEDFTATSYFQSKELIEIAGNTISSISKMILEQIGSLTLKKNREDEINAKLNKAKKLTNKEISIICDEKKESIEDKNSKFYVQEFDEPKLKGSAAVLFKTEEILDDSLVELTDKNESEEFQKTFGIETVDAFYEQISFFEESEENNLQKKQIEILDNDLKKGSSFKNGKFRIYRYFIDNVNKNTRKQVLEFLKKEYGTGGYTGVGEFNQQHDAKGIKFYKFNDQSQDFSFNWSEVSERIKYLIKHDKYFTSEEKLQYNEWLNEINIENELEIER